MARRTAIAGSPPSAPLGAVAPLDDDDRPLGAPLAQPETRDLRVEPGRRVAQAVQIGVHDVAARRRVLLDQRERRARDRRGVDAERAREGAREERLARAEVAGEEHQVPRREDAGDRPREAHGVAAGAEEHGPYGTPGSLRRVRLIHGPRT